MKFRSIALACVVLSAGSAYAGGPLTFSGSPIQSAAFSSESFAAQALNIVDTWTFTTTTELFANGGVLSVALEGSDWDFVSVVLSGPSGPFNFLATGASSDEFEIWRLASSSLAPGAYELTVTGNVLSPANVGSYSGNMNLSPVPEPETYALMLAGFGAMAFVARRRRPS